MYNNFPPEVYKEDSNIHGEGIFAAEDIAAGHTFGFTHVEDTSGNFHCDLIRTPLGGYLNHSDDSNTVIVKKGIYHILVAPQAILADTELTFNYRTHVCGATYVKDMLGEEE